MQIAATAAGEQIKAALGADTFGGDAHALLTTVYRDPRQAVKLRLEAARAARPYEKPWLGSIETRIVDELEALWTVELEPIARRICPCRRRMRAAVPLGARRAARRSW